MTNTQKQEFGQTLWKLAGTEALGIVIVATLRVDFFGRARELRLDAITGLDAIIYDERSREFIQPLQRAELEKAIEEPASRVGLRVEKGSLSGSGMTWDTNPERYRCWSTRWAR